MSENGPLVCVLCGALWPVVANRCPSCNGFCSWGPSKGADPSSWTVNKDGSWTPKPPPPPGDPYWQKPVE